MFGFKAEPVALVALINSALTLAVLFGVNLTDAQQGGIIVFVNALLAVFLRSQVTSSNTLEAAGTSRQQMQDVAKDKATVMVPASVSSLSSVPTDTTIPPR